MTEAFKENVVLEAHGPESAALMRDVAAELEAVGVMVDVHAEPSQPQAMVTWATATLAALWLTDKYFGAMIGDIGKGHFSKVKAALGKIFAKTLAPDATVQRVLTRADGKVVEERVFSGNFSIAHRSTQGWRAKLLFPLEVTEADYQRAVIEFLALLNAQQHDAATSPLERELLTQTEARIAEAPIELANLDARRYIDVLLFWNAAEARFRVVDVAQSAIRETLVSWPLGAADVR